MIWWGLLWSVIYCLSLYVFLLYIIHELRKRNNAVDEKCTLYPIHVHYPSQCVYNTVGITYIPHCIRPTIDRAVLLLRLLYEFYPFIIVHCMYGILFNFRIYSSSVLYTQSKARFIDKNNTFNTNRNNVKELFFSHLCIRDIGWYTLRSVCVILKYICLYVWVIVFLCLLVCVGSSLIFVFIWREYFKSHPLRH